MPGATTDVRRAARAGLALILLPVLAVAVYLVAGLAGAVIPGPPVGAEDTAAGPTVRVGLVAGPIHYDFLLPLTPAVRARFAFAESGGVPVNHPDAEWLVVGWGSRAFYTTVGTYADILPSAVWRAATGDVAVLRVDVIGPVLERAPIAWVPTTPAQFERLVTAVAEGATGTPLPLPGFTPTDAFFPVPGKFHLGRTCNVWLGERLRAAGLRFGIWTPTPQAVRLSLWWNGLAEG